MSCGLRQKSQIGGKIDRESVNSDAQEPRSAGWCIRGQLEAVHNFKHDNLRIEEDNLLDMFGAIQRLSGASYRDLAIVLLRMLVHAPDFLLSQCAYTFDSSFTLCSSSLFTSHSLEARHGEVVQIDGDVNQWMRSQLTDTRCTTRVRLSRAEIRVPYPNFHDSFSYYLQLITKVQISQETKLSNNSMGASSIEPNTTVYIRLNGQEKNRKSSRSSEDSLNMQPVLPSEKQPPLILSAGTYARSFHPSCKYSVQGYLNNKWKNQFSFKALDSNLKSSRGNDRPLDDIKCLSKQKNKAVYDKSFSPRRNLPHMKWKKRISFERYSKKMLDDEPFCETPQLRQGTVKLCCCFRYLSLF